MLLSNNDNPDYIVVEGPIGVGKTTLAKRLAETFSTDLMLELPAENPFLERFYQDPKNAALPTQLYFLFQRAKQIQSLVQTDMFRPVQVSDYLIQKDRIFAELNLDKDEFELYEQVYNQLTIDAPTPDLVIYLQAPTDVLLKRIGKRGINYERHINDEYLKKISNAYVDFFYHYSDSPLLIVNTEDFNLQEKPEDYELLLEQIRYHKSGRLYFNPKSI